MSSGLIAVIIVCIVIVMAIITKRCTECLFLGAILGAFALYGVRGFPMGFVETLETVVGDPDNVWLWLVCGLFGSLVALLTASRGTYGFQKIMGKICKTQRLTQLAAFILGILIFVDDYLNVLTVGVCMRGLYDKRKLPREALAYVIDSTGAPVCVILPFTTWAVFYANLFYSEDAVSSVYSSGISAYIHAIPFLFYPFLAILFVFLFAMGWMPKLGAMKKAFKRVEEKGMLYSEQSKKYNMDETEDSDEGSIWNFLIPMGVLVFIAIYTGEILLGVLAALIVCLVMYVPRKLLKMEEFMNLCVSGFGSILSVFFMLVGAFCLSEVCSGLGLTEYLMEVATPLISPWTFPAITFVLLALLAFVTGSDWGMSAVAIPIMIPMCAALNANLVLTMAALIAGGAFGSHACFYSDATLLSSSSSRIENMEHALSQWPYTFIAAGISVVLLLVFGFRMT